MKKTSSRILETTALLVLVGMPSLPAEESEGAAMYAEKCAMCHGEDGVAKIMAANSGNFNDPEWQKKSSLKTIVDTIVNGKGKMPGYEGRLTPEQITALAKYVKSMSSKDAAGPSS